MLTGILLLVIAYLMIYVEFYLPGGVLAVLGGCAFLAAIIVFAQGSDSLLLVIGFTFGAIGGLVLLTLLALRRIKNAPAASSVYSEGDQTGYRSSGFDEKLIGREGTTDTDLRRSGFVRIDGLRYQAISQVGYLDKGTPIQVIGGEGAHLVVKSIERK